MAIKQVEFTDVVLDSMGRNMTACKAKLHAKLTGKLAAAMGWEEMPEYLDGGTVDTDLQATTIELTPKQGEMGKYGVNLKTRRMYNFSFTKVQEEGKGQKKKQPHTEVHFVVDLIDEKALAGLERFQLNCGALKTTLRVNYEPSPKQGTLVDVTNTSNDKQASLIEQ